MYFNPNPNISYFAKTNFRKDGKVFGIYQYDLAFHLLLLGKTGTGKSTLLKTLIYQDVINNRGFTIFDLHNDLIPDLRNYLPQHRIKDIIYLDIPNPNMNYLYNPFKNVEYEKRSMVTGSILEILKKLFSASWGNRLENILRHIILTLLDTKNSNFGDIPKIIYNKEFREKVISNIINEDVKRFWIDDFPTYKKGELAPVLNKVSAFLSYPAIKRLLITNTNEISLREIMDNKKILLLNISKGELGSDVSDMVGSLILTGLTNAGFSRVDIQEHQRITFKLYLDEFQNYTNKSIISLLSEIRKYKLNLILATQYLSALNTEIRDSLLGNVGSQIIFRLSQFDARYFEKEFSPEFKSIDITSMNNYDIYIKMMINGAPSKPFSATTIRYQDYF